MSKLQPVDILNERQLAAVLVLSDPANATMSYKDKAELIGISSQTLYNWRKDPDFVAALKDAQEAMLEGARSLADKSLLQQVGKGDVSALSLYYRLVGRLREADEYRPTAQRIEINIVQAPAREKEKTIDVEVEYLD